MSPNSEASPNDHAKFLYAECARLIRFATARIAGLDMTAASDNADEAAILEHTLGNVEHLIYMHTVYETCEKATEVSPS